MQIKVVKVKVLFGRDSQTVSSSTWVHTDFGDVPRMMMMAV